MVSKFITDFEIAMNSLKRIESPFVISKIIALHISELKIELTRLEDIETKFNLLAKAVNESKSECTPECDSYGHSEACKTLNPCAWLIDQQKKIEDGKVLYDDLVKKYQKMMGFYDDHVGTPCEQIRWANERESLLDKIEVLKKELAEAKEPVKDERMMED